MWVGSRGCPGFRAGDLSQETGPGSGCAELRGRVAVATRLARGAIRVAVRCDRSHCGVLPKSVSGVTGVAAGCYPCCSWE